MTSAALWGEPARMHTCTQLNAGGLGSMGGIVVVLLCEHGMLWNTGGKNQNMCMHRVWSNAWIW